MLHTRYTLLLLVIYALCGCAVNERSYWAITDSTMYWDRVGFSITAPSGPNWYKMPRDDNHPNSITFYKGEGLVLKGTPEKWIYMQGTVAFAEGVFLPLPIPQSYKVSALQKFLENYSIYSTTKVNDFNYDNSFGYDCLKYSGALKEKRLPSEMGDVHTEDVTGYLCLHPQTANFIVLMESRNLATMGTDTWMKKDQVEHFFRGLRFKPISSATSRITK